MRVWRPVQRGKLCGYVDKKGQLVIPLKFDAVGEFSEGLAAVNAGGKVGYIDKTGAWRIQLQSDVKVVRNGILVGYGAVEGAGTFKCGFAMVEKPNSRSVYFIDKSGKRAFGRDFEDGGEFSENLAPVEVNRKWGFIDTDGRFAIQPKLDPVMGGYSYGYDSFRDGLAFVQVGKSFGFMDRTGKIVIQPRFYLAYPSAMFGVPGYYYVLLKANTMGVIDKSGKVIYQTTSKYPFGD